jgi:hypothetical protein
VASVENEEERGKDKKRKREVGFSLLWLRDEEEENCGPDMKKSRKEIRTRSRLGPDQI